LQVVDQSIRDIEALATTRAKVVAGSTQPPATTRPVYIAALMGIAAGLLIAVGVTVLVKTSPELDTPIAVVPPTTRDVPPAQPEEEPLPKLLPVVAVVSEQVGFPAGTTSSSFAVGSLFRIEDEISFE